MNQNGFATMDNSAWFLVKGIRTVLLWIGSISVVVWILCHVPGWLEEMEEAKEKDRQAAIQRLETTIQKQVDPVWDYCSKLSSEIKVLKTKIEAIELERKKEAIVIKEVEQRQNRSADEVTADALSDFI